MALLKIARTIRRYGIGATLRKLVAVAPAYLSGVSRWRLRRCRCCCRLTVFLTDSSGSAESRACLFCSANERYELLATEIKTRFGSRLPQLDVLELDPRSPLKPLLSRARSYNRSFYESEGASKAFEGAVFQDITALSLADASLDLIVSSDVLEHVPQLDKALAESSRVLRPGGAHLFTVPPRARTRKRAEIVNGVVVHKETPEYHGDPMTPQGILAFWDVGPDLAEALPVQGLDIRISCGPTLETGRVVWSASRVS